MLDIIYFYMECFSARMLLLNIKTILYGCEFLVLNLNEIRIFFWYKNKYTLQVPDYIKVILKVHPYHKALLEVR